VRRMRLLYGHRQAALIEGVREHLDGALALQPAAAGMHLVGRLAPGLDDLAVSREARAAGVEAPPLSAFYRGTPSERGLLLGYAGVGEAEMAKATVRLARAVGRVRAATPPPAPPRPDS
jgi:GntR family transcriptional regulator / MocR family aminotransferase